MDVVDVAVVVNEAAFVDVDTEEDAGESFPVNDPPSTPELSALAAALSSIAAVAIAAGNPWTPPPPPPFSVALPPPSSAGLF